MRRSVLFAVVTHDFSDGDRFEALSSEQIAESRSRSVSQGTVLLDEPSRVSDEHISGGLIAGGL